jgi:hypothetical protein
MNCSTKEHLRGADGPTPTGTSRSGFGRLVIMRSWVRFPHPAPAQSAAPLRALRRQRGAAHPARTSLASRQCLRGALRRGRQGAAVHVRPRRAVRLARVVVGPVRESFDPQAVEHRGIGRQVEQFGGDSAVQVVAQLGAVGAGAEQVVNAAEVTAGHDRPESQRARMPHAWHTRSTPCTRSSRRSRSTSGS